MNLTTVVLSNNLGILLRATKIGKKISVNMGICLHPKILISRKEGGEYVELARIDYGENLIIERWNDR